MNLSIDHRIDVSRKLQEAVHCHKTGRLESAEKGYRRILEILPDHADTLHLLGLVYSEKGALSKAKEFIQRAIQVDAGVPIFYVSFGDVLQREGSLAEAAFFYRKALQLNPNLVEALCNLGNTLCGLEDYEQALECYKKALGVNSCRPEVFNNMGLAYHHQREYVLAESYFKRSISLSPGYVEAHNNLGNLYRDKSDLKAALEQYQQALRLAPENTAVHYNIGVLYQTNNKIDEAVGHYRKAVEHQPPIADAHNNLGKNCQDRNQPGQAIYHFDKAIELEPDHFDAHFNRSLSLLAIGRFEEGWQEYEWRFKRDDWRRIYPHRLKGPRWDGSQFQGKKLFIHSEQGFGDTIWFVRYLPQVKSLGGDVILETRSELIGLLQNFAGINQMVPMSFEHPPQISYDAYVPLMSLAGVLATNLDTIPATVPYLHAPEAERESWSRRIKGPDFKIGLVWAAKPTNEHERSCPLEKLLPLFNLKNIRIYGLQKSDAALQANNLKAEVINLGPQFETFADTAGAIDCLDLIISVDTAVAHLAGAMGKPVWILLPCAADWKWMIERRDSPWYPTMRLFRQPYPGDWESVVSMVIAELKQLA